MFFNPPHYKGIVVAIIVGFAKSGLPIKVDLEDLTYYHTEIEDEDRRLWNETPKTGFAVID